MGTNAGPNELRLHLSRGSVRVEQSPDVEDDMVRVRGEQFDSAQELSSPTLDCVESAILRHPAEPPFVAIVSPRTLAVLISAAAAASHRDAQRRRAEQAPQLRRGFTLAGFGW